MKYRPKTRKQRRDERAANESFFEFFKHATTTRHHGAVVRLTEVVYGRLVDEYGRDAVDAMAEELDAECLAEGKRYENFGAEIRRRLSGATVERFETIRDSVRR